MKAFFYSLSIFGLMMALVGCSSDLPVEEKQLPSQLQTSGFECFNYYNDCLNWCRVEYNAGVWKFETNPTACGLDSDEQMCQCGG